MGDDSDISDFIYNMTFYRILMEISRASSIFFLKHFAKRATLTMVLSHQRMFKNLSLIL